MEQVGPLIVGVGGTTDPGSSIEKVMKHCLEEAEAMGARTILFGSEALVQLGHYRGPGEELPPGGADMLAAFRAADGFIFGSPAYHGSVSGLMKNALDYFENTALDQRPYCSERPVGLVSTAYSWPAASNTMAALRSIVHGLRGWPTPFGAALNVATASPDRDDEASMDLRKALKRVARQVTVRAQRDSATPIFTTS